MIVELETDEYGNVILPLGEELCETLGWKLGDEIVFADLGTGGFSITKQEKETELVLVEVVTQFLHRYVVEVPKGKAEWSLDTVAMGGDIKDLGQKFLGENTIGHRVVSREEALALGKETCEWMDEGMLEHCINRDKND